MKHFNLGEFEEIVMLTVGKLHGEAYGVSIKQEIETKLVRKVSIGALQSALVRLEAKGYLKSSEGSGTEERAGRPRKYYEMTALGKRAIEHARSTREALWQSLPQIVLDLKFSR